jgi:hypothetical protein
MCSLRVVPQFTSEGYVLMAPVGRGALSRFSNATINMAFLGESAAIFPLGAFATG